MRREAATPGAAQHDDDCCRVCRGGPPRAFLTVEGRDYLRCPDCAATLLAAGQLPTAAEERAHYGHHENDPADPGYRAFLSRLAAPLLERAGPPPLTALDYGCGPGPALAAMLAEAGHSVSLYDPFFFPDDGALARRYDLVVSTETVEHFHAPAEEFDRLDALLRPGGWLGVMTCFQTEDARFADWHYRRDPTHVVFYRQETLGRLAAQRGWSFESPRKDVAIFRKS